jgi:hypothetical protein
MSGTNHLTPNQTPTANHTYSGDLFHMILDVFVLMICVGYPIWRSYKVIEAKKTSDNELIQWLTYWVVFSTYTKLEDYADYMLDLVHLYLVNLQGSGRLAAFAYKLLKLIIVAWMIHPRY